MTDHTPCPACGFVIKRVELKPLVIDEGAGMNDLVKRLGMLAHHLHSLDSESGEGKLLTDAAARIEALEAELVKRDAVIENEVIVSRDAQARIEALEAALTVIANDPDTNSEARAYARNTLAAWRAAEKGVHHAPEK